MLAFIKTLGSGAAGIARTYYQKGVKFSAKKGVDHFVTQADLEIETFLKKQILNKYPQHLIVAEESADENWQILKKNNVWVIDPLDGTANFLKKIPLYGISIAYCQFGKPKIGLIAIPETNQFYWAEKGKGAFMNNQRLKIIKKPASQQTIATGYCAQWQKTAENLRILLKLLPFFGGVRVVGCATVALSLVTQSSFAALFYNSFKPWDTAAGWLLVEEAGGVVATLGGKRYQLTYPEKAIAGEKGTVQKICRLLKRKD